MNTPWSRRSFLASSLGAPLAAPLAARAQQRGADGKPPRFLIVLSAFGGANVVDSFLSVRESESAAPSEVNAYPDGMVQTIGAFRAIDMKSSRIGAIPAAFSANQSSFVKKHQQDMMVVTHTGTSVNHFVAQQRSINGNAAWLGRTLQEAVALTYGQHAPIPNVHLVNGTGFTERGTDNTLPSYACGERAPSPNLWPLSLDGYRGIKGAPPRDLVDAARALRNDQLDPATDFTAAFGDSERIRRWLAVRGQSQRNIEGADLITRLMLFPDSATMPLGAYGLQSSALGEKVRAAFPNYDFDPLEAQAALAFLLLRYGVSVTVTLGPAGGAVFRKGISLTSDGLQEGDIVNTPISFDFSHQASREVQALMWDRVLKTADRLITLLKSEEYADGKSYWDHSMIYVATEFGRTRKRPPGAMTYGTGHELNNGSLIISPLVNGGKVLGGVDPDTILTYGFDPLTGAPQKGRTMTEQEIYSGIVQALGVPTPGAGLPDMRAMRKA